MKTYHKVYCYNVDTNLYPKAEPCHILYKEGEDGRVDIVNLEPDVTWYFRLTAITKEEYMAHVASTLKSKDARVPYPRIEVFQGRDGIWRYHDRLQDGTIGLTNNEKYKNKWSAKRGAKRFQKKLAVKLPIVVLSLEELARVSAEEAEKRRVAKAAEKAAARDLKRRPKDNP